MALRTRPPGRVSLGLVLIASAAGTAGTMLATGAAPAAAEPLIFQRTDYTAGYGALWFAAGDWNRDGDLDLAVSDFAVTSIDIFLGNGTGQLLQIAAAPAGNGPWGIVAGDWNRDGNLDLAAACTQTDEVTTALGDGQGGFVFGTSLPTGDYPRAILTADFDEDGWADLAVSNLVGDTVAIFFGDGQGGFTAGLILTGGDGPGAGSGADLDADGHADIAIGNQNSHDVSVWFGDGTGAFAPRLDLPIVNHAHTAIAGYADADSHLDLIADNVNSSPPVVSVLRGDGNRGFAPAASFATGDSAPAHVAIGDLDRDGFADLVAARRATASIAVLRGDGVGAFGAPEVFAVGLTPNCVLIEDLDRDGRLDLTISNFGQGTITVLMNRTATTAADAPGPPIAAPPAAVIDPLLPHPHPLGSVAIGWRSALPAPAVLRVIDVAGREVATLQSAERARGRYVAHWQARAPGVYFVELRTGDTTARRKIVLAK